MREFDFDRSWAKAELKSGEEWTAGLLNDDGRPREDYWRLANEATVRLENEIYACDRVKSYMLELQSNGDDTRMQQLLLDDTQELLGEARADHRDAVLKRMRADELLEEIRWKLSAV